MSSENEDRINIGIEDARKRLGSLVTAAQQGTDVVLTRNGRAAARITPYVEEVMTTYTAALATASDVVVGDFCDVSVVENEIVGYREDDEGNETPEYGMTDKVVLDAVELGVRTDADDVLTEAPDEADLVLRASGWTRVGDWSVADNALYAQVERA